MKLREHLNEKGRKGFWLVIHSSDLGCVAEQRGDVIKEKIGLTFTK